MNPRGITGLRAAVIYFKPRQFLASIMKPGFGNLKTASFVIPPTTWNAAITTPGHARRFSSLKMTEPRGDGVDSTRYHGDHRDAAAARPGW